MTYPAMTNQPVVGATLYHGPPSEQEKQRWKLGGKTCDADIHSNSTYRYFALSCCLISSRCVDLFNKSLVNITIILQYTGLNSISDLN